MRFCPEEKRYYICHCVCWMFPWCHSVVFAALFDIIKWIDISNICSAQRVLIQWRWTMSCSHSGTASDVCLFNHSCRNEIKRHCVVKPLKRLPQQRDQEGPTTGSRAKNKLGLAANAVLLLAVSWWGWLKRDIQGSGCTGELHLAKTLSHIDMPGARSTKRLLFKWICGIVLP